MHRLSIRTMDIAIVTEDAPISIHQVCAVGGEIQIPDEQVKLWPVCHKGKFLPCPILQRVDALFVQGFDQLKEKYSDNIANTIKGNCQVWAYLQSDDPETLREMSDKLGSYTTSSYQLSASNGKYTTPSNSQSVSLTERKLLNTDEVRRVKRPHQIITSRDHPAMMYAPDLSQWMFNKMLGLGDMEHNRRLREEREQKRPIITDTKQEIALWNIWIYYQKDIMRRLAQQKGAMGGGLDDD